METRIISSSRRLALVLWVVVVGVLALPVMAAKQWETDFEKAQAMAKASNRYLLLDFSGSDWCGWCIKLEEEVFSKKEFKKYADDHLVCVLIDFPRRKALKKNLQEQNEMLAKKFGIRGYPSVIILSPDGEKVGRTGYQAGGAENYVTHLKGIIDPHREQNNVPEPAAVAAGPGRQPVRGLVPQGLPANLARDETRELRTWKTKSGSSTRAALLEERPPFMILRQDDGTELRVSKHSLCEEDLQYIADLKGAGGADPGGAADEL
ncbi:MAG: thioredoxin family protein [Candidatus Marinimicrobia bacterium]|nr:thioredoxin family protein [Candidatus Neomarinimicrobiota bacterium]